MKRIKEKSLYLLDMDGTIYLGNKLIDGALSFINSLVAKNLDYVFMTNNSSKSAADYLKKLEAMNIPANKDNMFTSGQAAAYFLSELKKNAKIFVVGTKSFKTELKSYGFDIIEKAGEKIDFLLVGYDTELNYEKLVIACSYLCDGVPFYATNPDVVCPAENGRYLPDCATMCYMLEKATGKQPFYIGKPRKEMALTAVKFKKTTPERAVLVGDRLYTDIQCGLNAGILSVLVLSGESTKDDIEKFKIYPDIVTDKVADLIY